jgi:uncharacterized protein (TIGR03066 family)
MPPNFGKVSAMRILLGSVAVLAVIGGLTLADDQVDAEKLIGKWELAEAKKGQSLTLEFLAGMKINVVVGDVKLDGTYSVFESNKMNVTFKFMNEDIKESLIIKKLTNDELVTEDSKGKTESFKKKK